jgi:hypothetical protein
MTSWESLESKTIFVWLTVVLQSPARWPSQLEGIEHEAGVRR